MILRIPLRSVLVFAVTSALFGSLVGPRPAEAQVQALGVESARVPILHDPHDLAISPDGLYLYATEFGLHNRNSRIFHFSREPSTGKLTLQSFVNAETEYGERKLARITLSPDGKNAYVSVFKTGGVLFFERDETNGALVHLGSLQPSTSDGSGVLEGPSDIEFSDDGAFAYVLGQVSGGVKVLSRNGVTGLLTHVQELNLSASKAFALTVSHDQQTVYVASDSALHVLSRNGTTGMLQEIQAYPGSFGRSLLEDPERGRILALRGNGFVQAFSVEAMGMVAALGEGVGPLVSYGIHLESSWNDDEAMLVGYDSVEGLCYLGSNGAGTLDIDTLSGVPEPLSQLERNCGRRALLAPDGEEYAYIAATASSSKNIVSSLEILRDGPGNELLPTTEAVDSDAHLRRPRRLFPVQDARLVVVSGDTETALYSWSREGAAGHYTLLETWPSGGILSPDGNDLYLSNEDGGQHLRLDRNAGSFSAVGAIPAGLRPKLANFSPDGTVLFGDDHYLRNPATGVLTLEGGSALYGPSTENGDCTFELDRDALQMYCRNGSAYQLVDEIEDGADGVTGFRSLTSPQLDEGDQTLWVSSAETDLLFEIQILQHTGSEDISVRNTYDLTESAHGSLSAFDQMLQIDDSWVFPARYLVARNQSDGVQLHLIDLRGGANTYLRLLHTTEDVSPSVAGGIGHEVRVALDSDGRHVHLIDTIAGNLILFDLDRVFGGGFETGDTSRWSAAKP